MNSLLLLNRYAKQTRMNASSTNVIAHILLFREVFPFVFFYDFGTADLFIFTADGPRWSTDHSPVFQIYFWDSFLFFQLLSFPLFFSFDGKYRHFQIEESFTFARERRRQSNRSDHSSSFFSLLLDTFSRRNKSSMSRSTRHFIEKTNSSDSSR